MGCRTSGINNGAIANFTLGKTLEFIGESWSRLSEVQNHPPDEQGDEERQRAEVEHLRAEEERQRADRLAERLRSLGIDPEAD